MKSLYAIPPDASEAAETLASLYSVALSTLAENVIALGDDLRSFAESHGAAVLKVDDDDWARAMEGLSEPHDRDLAGRLFWSTADAVHVHQALEQGADHAARQTVSTWLRTQGTRQRSVLLVTA